MALGVGVGGGVIKECSSKSWHFLQWLRSHNLHQICVVSTKVFFFSFLHEWHARATKSRNAAPKESATQEGAVNKQLAWHPAHLAPVILLIKHRTLREGDIIFARNWAHSLSYLYDGIIVFLLY